MKEEGKAKLWGAEGWKGRVPVVVEFAVVGGKVLADPTGEEEGAAEGIVKVGSDGDKVVWLETEAVGQPEGVPQSIVSECVTMAHKRAKKITDLLNNTEL